MDVPSTSYPDLSNPTLPAVPASIPNPPSDLFGLGLAPNEGIII